MVDEWEEFLQGPSKAGERRLTVSLSPRSELSLNRWVIEAIGNPRAVVLLFDRARSRIGLRASPSEVPHAFSLTHGEDHKRRRPFTIYLKAFCKTHNIRNQRTIRFAEPTIDQGILVLDLPESLETG